VNTTRIRHRSVGATDGVLLAATLAYAYWLIGRNEHHSRARHTAEAWLSLSARMRPADMFLKSRFTVIPPDQDQMLQLVRRATQARTEESPPEAIGPGKDLRIFETLRSYVNDLNEFVSCVELGIYDEHTAQALAGYRIQREFIRYRDFVGAMRLAIGSHAVFGELERFSDRFSRTRARGGTPPFRVTDRLGG
jgi:hypothetical protein